MKNKKLGRVFGFFVLLVMTVPLLAVGVFVNNKLEEELKVEVKKGAMEVGRATVQPFRTEKVFSTGIKLSERHKFLIRAPERINLAIDFELFGALGNLFWHVQGATNEAGGPMGNFADGKQSLTVFGVGNPQGKIPVFLGPWKITVWKSKVVGGDVFVEIARR